MVDSTGERHTIGRTLVIGRESAEIAVDDLEVSRRHATIRPLDDGGLELYDLDSANGAFVNDLRLGSQPLRLEAGDVIRVGRSALRVERLTSAAEREHLPTVIRRKTRSSSYMSCPPAALQTVECAKPVAPATSRGPEPPILQRL